MAPALGSVANEVWKRPRLSSWKSSRKRKSATRYVLLLLATWVLGLINAFQHAKDAWATMPSGLILSVIVSLLACAAVWVGLKMRMGGGQ